MKLQGNLALESFSLLNGALIMLNGVHNQAKEDGTVVVKPTTKNSPGKHYFFFDVDVNFTIKEN